MDNVPCTTYQIPRVGWFMVHGMWSIIMNHEIVKTKAERREKRKKPKMAVSGRNTKKLAQLIANRSKR
jgi:hypothetical protein